MRTTIFAAYTLGAAAVGGVIGSAVANRVPWPASLVVWLLFVCLGGWYGFRNAAKRHPSRDTDITNEEPLPSSADPTVVPDHMA